MARDLNELKAVLWDAFEEARDRHSSYSDDAGHYNGDLSFKMQNRAGLSDLVRAIVAIEAEQRMQNESYGRVRGKAANAG